jgi:thiopeptide-type bacteriocin biosynthesis protein
VSCDDGARDDVEMASLERYLRARMAARGEAIDEDRIPAAIERAAAAIDAAIDDVVPRKERDGPWLYLRLPMPSGDRGEFLKLRLAPLLGGWSSRHPLDGCWWLYKPDPFGDAIRLRVRLRSGVDTELRRVLRAECEYVLGGEVASLRYEPELRLFGGPVGMALAHVQFMRESEFLLAWAQASDARIPTLPHGLSLAIVLAMLRAAGLDTFECWDVFDKVCAKRPAPPRGAGDMAGVRTLTHRIAAADPEQVFALYDGPRREALARYSACLRQFGQEASRACYSGRLEGGLREFFAPIILFHWNRVRMPWPDQLALAHGWRAVFAELSQQGSRRK